MAAPANELQAAIYSALMANIELSAIVGDRIYDRVPTAGDQAPFVTFGESSETPEGMECIDADLHVIQINVWSEGQGGSKEAKEALKLVERSVVGVDLNLDSHASHRPRKIRKSVKRDPDGITTHGLIQVAVFVEDNG